MINDNELSELVAPITEDEPRVPHLLKFGVLMIGAVLAVFLIWASIAPVEEIASAQGQVVPNGYVQTIQHLEGGMVRDILVHDGDMVDKGQVLLRLDNVSANADLGQMRARQNALRHQAMRLRGFVSGSMPVTDLSENERAILSSMQEARASQQNVVRDQLAQKEKELRALQATETALRKNLPLLQKETGMHQSMAAKGYGSQLVAMNSERELNQLQGQLQEIASQKSRARDGINEARNRLQSVDADFRQDAMKNLGLVEAELAEVNKSIAKTEDVASRTNVVSPVRGVVKGLSIHTLGAVIEPGKVLMEIVPVEEDLIVEAMVQPNDIGHLKNGQPVKVKVSAFDFSRYGAVTGRLNTISATTFQNEKDQSFYKVKIRMDRNYVGKNPQKNTILPGMVVQADIVTGDKTVLQYLLKPIHVTMANAFHEN